MKHVIIYHNPKCSKSRAALQQLQASNVEITIRLYLEQPLKATEIATLINSTENAHHLIRDKESIFTDFITKYALDTNIKAKDLTKTQMAKAIQFAPVLLQRPIVVIDNQAYIVRDEQILGSLPL